MDLNKLKKFSRNMRVKLIEQIEQRLNYVLGVEDEYTQVHSDASMAFVGNTSKRIHKIDLGTRPALLAHPEARFFELAGVTLKDLLPDDLLHEFSPVEGVQVVETYVVPLYTSGII